MRLLSDTLERLVAGCGTTVVAIAGNHDSPERLEFCSGVLARTGLHVVGRPAAAPAVIDVVGAGDRIQLAAVPYTEPAVARDLLDDAEIRSHDAALARLVAGTRGRLDATVPGVLLAHAFVAGGTPSESERSLSVGGADQVDVAHLAGFDYVALGHLHRPQQVGETRVRYSGSLLKYSFAECDHTKSVELVELVDGQLRCERIGLTPRRDVRRLQGTLVELLAAADDDAHSDDYIEATLTDPGVVRDPLGRLRAFYPNVLHIARPALAAATAADTAAGRHRRLGIVELFDAFYRERRERPLDDAQRAILHEIAEAIAAREREVVE